MSTYNNTEDLIFYNESGNYSDTTCISIIKPNVCPHCNYSISSKVETHTQVKANYTFAVIFSCPNCSEFFVELFKSVDLKYAFSVGYSINKTIDKDIPNEIKVFSPKFIEIYTQALTAESNNLNEIAGLGLRKAIEFLTKDYLIRFIKEDESLISSLPLGRAINKIPNPLIKPLIERIVWLGNDEAHYIKKHLDRDIHDMKKFIKALYTIINTELVIQDALTIENK